MKKASKQSAAKAKSNKKPTKATPAPAETQQSATLAPVVTIRERRDIAPANLAPAPWNPRGEITPESVADLTASIATVGIIEPVVVMPCASADEFVIVAGHRRVAAARNAGLATIPCDVLTGIDEAQARRMTFIENLQRRDADPILESELVGNLLKDGMTQAEIAAETGRGEKWVARRANLVNLSPSWRKRLADGERIAIDCLEHVAAYPQELQEELKSVTGDCWRSKDAPLTWGDVRRHFADKSRKLSEAAFNTSKCLSCPRNSGCCPGLFDDVEIGATAKLGQCLDAKCWLKSTNAHIDETVEKAKAKDHTVLNGSPYSHGVYCNTTKRPTKTNTTLYVYTESYSGLKVCEWGEPPKKNTKSDEEDSAAAREADLAAKREKRERNKAIRKLADLCAADDNLARWLKMLASARVSAPFVIQHLFAGIDSYRLDGTETEITDAALAYFLGTTWPSTLPDIYFHGVAASVILNTNPTRNDWTAHKNAMRLCALFPDEIRDAGLTDEEAAHILSPSARQSLALLAVKWGEKNLDDDTDDPSDDADNPSEEQ